ncbi:hypothetical protein QF037_001979 [Streptomyces canus]|nr:hypothetical protein [Streptomyces canus]
MGIARARRGGHGGGGQGLASRADGTLLYRGLAAIPLDLRLKGWNHVGDPDIARGYSFDAYQGPDTATSKMFAVTTPAGKCVRSRAATS